MIGNKTIVGLVITTIVLSCVAVAVTADEGRVEPMAIMPGAITNIEIATDTVNDDNILNSEDFTFGGVEATGAVTLGSGDDAIAINPGTGALTVTGGTGGINIDTTAGAITIDANGATSNFNLASTDAGQDLTIGVTGDNDASLVLSSTGTGADALQISTTAGGIDIAAVSTVAGEDLDIGITGETGELRLASASTGEDAISIQSSAGGVDVDAAAAKDVTIDGGQVAIVSKDNAASAISLTTDVGTTETIVVTNTQGNTAGAIALTASAGGVDIDGATGVTVDATDNAISINGGTGTITLGGTVAIRTIAIGTDNALQTINIGTNDAPANVIGIGGTQSTTTFKGTVVMPSGGAVAHLLNSSDTVMTVTGSTYADADEVLNTSTGSDHITTQGATNFIITYSANTSVSAGKLIITNISVLNSAGATLKTATPTNISFADSQATNMQNTIQVFVTGVSAADNMDIVVRARRTGSGTVSVQNQTLTVIAV